MAGPLAAAYSYQYPLQQQYQLQRMKQARRRRYNPPNQTSFNDDNHQTKALQSCLEAFGNQPTSHDDAIRWVALEELEVLLNRWTTSMRTFQSNNQIITNLSNNNKKWTKPKVCLIPFGSFRLGVHRNDADMDCLCLAPPTTSRVEFFTSLVKLLQNDVRVNQVHAITSAYTPVIKFIFLGLHVDLLFARLEHPTKLSQHQSTLDGMRNEYIIDDTDLTALDEASVRSLNGARVAQYILSVVPNVDAFRLTLRAIKEWAVAHGLYSNVLGFLGGVNLAILVAWVCKRQDKNTSPPALLKVFFQTFAKWKWPLPIMLLQPAYQPPQGVLPMVVWNARTNGRDAQCIMPILTPCYPSMNSSYNVGVPQLRRMQMEFFVASQTLDQIENGEKNWTDLYQGNDFFEQHIHFLQVNISADNSASFVEWFRFCESRLRLLIAGLEAPDFGLQVFPFAKFFHQRFDEKGQYLGVGTSETKCRQEASFFVGLRFAYGVETLDLRFCMSEFLHIVNTWVGRRQGMDLTAEIVRKHDLPDYTKLNQVTLNNCHALTESAEIKSNATTDGSEPEESEIVTEELSTDDTIEPDEIKTVTEESLLDEGKGLNNSHMLRKANYAAAVLLQIASPSKRPRT